MLDIGAGELLGLALVALVLLGPSKLPAFAADAARFIKKFVALRNRQPVICVRISALALKI